MGKAGLPFASLPGMPCDLGQVTPFLPGPSISYHQPSMVAGLGFPEQQDLEFSLRSNPNIGCKSVLPFPLLSTLEFIKDEYTNLEVRQWGYT